MLHRASPAAPFYSIARRARDDGNPDHARAALSRALDVTLATTGAKANHTQAHPLVAEALLARAAFEIEEATRPVPELDLAIAYLDRAETILEGAYGNRHLALLLPQAWRIHALEIAGRPARAMRSAFLHDVIRHRAAPIHQAPALVVSIERAIQSAPLDVGRPLRTLIKRQDAALRVCLANHAVEVAQAAECPTVPLAFVARAFVARAFAARAVARVRAGEFEAALEDFDILTSSPVRDTTSFEARSDEPGAGPFGPGLAAHRALARCSLFFASEHHRARRVRVESEVTREEMVATLLSGLDAAQVAIARAPRCAPNGERFRRAVLETQLETVRGRVWLRCRDRKRGRAEAERSFRRAISRFSRLEGHAPALLLERARLRTDLGALWCTVGRREEGVRFLHHAYACANSHGDDVLAARAAHFLAVASQRVTPATHTLSPRVWFERALSRSGSASLVHASIQHNFALYLARGAVVADAQVTDAPRTRESTTVLLRLPRADQPIPEPDVDTPVQKHADALLRAAVTTREKLLPAGHSAVARSVHALAGIADDRGDFDGAEGLYERALFLFEGAGELSQGVVVMRDLAALLRARGKTAAAKLLEERAESRVADASLGG